MRENRTSGSMSGDGRRSHDPVTTAPVLDSTQSSAATADLAALTGVLAARTHQRMYNTFRVVAAASARHDGHLRGLATNPVRNPG